MQAVSESEVQLYPGSSKDLWTLVWDRLLGMLARDGLEKSRARSKTVFKAKVREQGRQGSPQPCRVLSVPSQGQMGKERPVCASSLHFS